ncbi:kelch-like protein 3 [Episyrphus balteatus]|uniref:kelch-like protein 3 n=1 Tax=Episyrphus balteatus TaxID=286459 RepID=UPI002485C4AB|nr:kelch-like protein 3 [Episyrphus balteatus]
MSSSSSKNNNEKIIFKSDQNGQKVLDFFKANVIYDTSLKAGNNTKFVLAHKVVLCATSEYFFNLLHETKSQPEESKTKNVVELKEIADASALQQIIDFMYSGSIELTCQTVKGILRTASFLKMQTLINGCCELIEKNINFDNSLNLLCIANELGLPTLKAKSLECINSNFDKITKKTEFLKLNENELKDILFFNENLNKHFEKVVFLSMVAWINYDKLNREHLVFELLSKIRYWLLTPKFIVENRKAVCKTVESYELICSWLQWHLSPETRSNDEPNCQRPKTDGQLSVVNLAASQKAIHLRTFDPKENAWSIKAKLNLPSKIKNPSMIVIDGKLIIAGGWQNANNVWCFDLATSKWIDLPPMLNVRLNCQLADLNGYLCVFSGGETSIEIYNFHTKTWTELYAPKRFSPKSKIAVHNTKLYILDFQERSLQKYDISTNKWTSRNISYNALTDYGLVADDKYLYIFGGSFNYNSFGDYGKTVYRYDLFNNDAWCEIAHLPSARPVKAEIFGNKIIICDGENFEEFDINTQTWNNLASISKGLIEQGYYFYKS